MHGLASDMNEDFYTADSFLSFAGSVAIVFLLGNTARVLVGRDSRGIPFFIAIGVAYLGAAIVGVNEWYGWVIPIINGCLLYWSAFGATVALVEAKEGAPTGGPKPHGKQEVKWLSYWGAEHRTMVGS